MSVVMTYEEYHILKDTWDEEVKLHSSIKLMKEHDICHTLIKEGIAILPFVFRDLKRDMSGVHTCVILLEEITHDSPIKPAHQGCVVQMRDDWLEYGREKGY